MWILTRKVDNLCFGGSFSQKKPKNNEPNLKWEEFSGELPGDFDFEINKYEYNSGSIDIRATYLAEKLQEGIVNRREQECVNFVNKNINPIVWDKLTTPQKKDVTDWWDDWHNATKESEIPERPTVLDQFDPAPQPIGKKKAKK